VAGGQRKAESVPGLRKLLGRETIERRRTRARKPCRRTVGDDRLARRRHGEHGLEGDADRQIVLAGDDAGEPALVELARGKGRSEAFAGDRGGTEVAVVEELVAGRGKPRRRAVEDVDLAGVVLDADVAVRSTDRQVVEVVPVEVAGGQRPAEAIAGRRRPEHAARAGAQRLAPFVEQPGGTAIEDVDNAHVARRAGVLEGDADGEVVEAVVVEVAHRQRVAELVVDLRHAVDRVVLADEAAKAGGRRAVDPLVDPDPAGVGDRRRRTEFEVVTRRAGGDVGRAVAVEVPGDDGRAEPVSRIADEPGLNIHRAGRAAEVEGEGAGLGTVAV